MSTFFPFSSLLLSHYWVWILPSNTCFPFTWLQGFFFVVFSSVKNPQEMTQGNFQKLSSTVLLYMFRWYWLKSWFYIWNSLTYVTSWAFSTSKDSFLISICVFFKAQFSHSYHLDYDLKKGLIKIKILCTNTLNLQLELQRNLYFLGKLSVKGWKRKKLLKIKSLCCFWDLKGYFYTSWLLGQTCCVR